MYDIAIIGAGPGGYVAAIKAAQSGAKVALIEQEQLGGVCLNRGCIPTKTLLHATEILKNIKSAPQYGIELTAPTINLPKLIARKNQVVKNLVKGLEWLMKSNQVSVIFGSAELRSPNSLDVNGTHIETKKLIIAVGSKPVLPPIPGVNSPGVITSDQALNLDKLPSSMAIIGAGAIGIEMAVLFQSLGCATTLLEQFNRVAPNLDQDLSKGLEEVLRRDGIKVITDAKVASINEGLVSYLKNGVTSNVTAELILVAGGRKPNGLSLDLDRLGIEHRQGAIITDQQLRTNLPDVYAVGDVNGRKMLAHVAMNEGLAAIADIFGKQVNLNYDLIPECIYSLPEVATVGLSETAAMEQGYKIKTSKIPATVNGRAMSGGHPHGFVKMVADTATGRILGCHILAPNATELITQATLIIDSRKNSAELADIVFPHPTVSELVSEAIHGISNRPIHL